MTEEEIARGYEKIAFGGIADAVRLLFCEETGAEELKSMDLFLVSEIKRPKGGGMEVKFLDRIRALQCLENMARSERNPQSIYEALAAGAENIREEGRVKKEE